MCTYKIYEVIPPTGYVLNNQLITVTGDFEGQTVEIGRADTGITDRVIKGQVAVTKFADRPLTGNSEDDGVKQPLEKGYVQQSVKEKLHVDIDNVKELSMLEKKKIKSYLNSLPEGNCLCHFDFHPGNVMVQNNSLFVIDWMTACIGNPNADVARTTILLQFGELPNVNPFIKMVIHIFEKRISNFYYEEYKRLTGVSA